VTDVFIAYSAKDRAIAARLANDLTAAGISVWWDYELIAGSEFRRVIIDNLTAARQLL
jgi:hypothetical protein